LSKASQVLNCVFMNWVTVEDGLVACVRIGLIRCFDRGLQETLRASVFVLKEKGICIKEKKRWCYRYCGVRAYVCVHVFVSTIQKI